MGKKAISSGVEILVNDLTTEIFIVPLAKTLGRYRQIEKFPNRLSLTSLLGYGSDRALPVTRRVAKTVAELNALRKHDTPSRLDPCPLLLGSHPCPRSRAGVATAVVAGAGNHRVSPARGSGQ